MTSARKQLLFTRLLLLFTVTIWGWTFVATKVALAYVAPHELLGLRLLVGLPILLAVIIKRKIRLQFNYHQNLNLILAAVVIAAHFLIQITGLKYTSATNTGWLISVTPLVLAILSVVFLKERVTRNQVIGIVVATVGILFLISHGDFTHIGWLQSIGDWLVLASAFTWAIYTVVTRDISRERNPAAITFALFLPCAVVLLAYMSFTSEWSHFAHLPLDGVVSILFLGIFGSALAQWFWQEGIARIGAARAGYFLYLEPVATTALAVPYLGEPFTAATVIGATCVMAGVYWAQRQVRS